MTKRAPKLADLAILGGKPAFQVPLPVGQMNFPEWEKLEASFRKIFARRYYTNHGPLVIELEDRLAKELGVRNVVCVTNATIALIIAAKALGLTGKVICPAFTFAATVQSLSWARIEPVFADVDPFTHQISVDAVKALIDDDVSGILGVHLWGNACNPEALEEVARNHGLHVYFDAAHAFGCDVAGKRIGNFGELEVFSFHATKVINAAEGGCIATNDDELAARLRNIRSSYGAGSTVEVPITANGRMSEAQAAMALLSLDEYPAVQQRNRTNYEHYEKLLGEIPGIRVLRVGDAGGSNYQYVVVEVSDGDYGVSRDTLLAILRAENVIGRRYFSPGLHRAVPYRDDFPQYRDALPNTDLLCKTVMQLPSGQGIVSEAISAICDVIRIVHENADSLQGVKGV